MNMEELLRSPQFKQALLEVQKEEWERIEAIAVPATFSPEFERKMEKLIRAQRKPYYPLINTNFKKVVFSFAIVTILLITTVFSVSALREPVVRFIVETYEKFSQVFFHHLEEEFPATLETYYAPTWLPMGYLEKTDQLVDVIIICERTYENENEDEIKFRQYTITTSLGIDTENVQAKSCSVSGKEGFFYSNKGIQNLSWSDGQYGFLLFGPVSEADLVRIAESIQPVK